ncbi:MAG: DUF1499 domain-containing protein [Proteobacteria bacterium]|nr:DUF1499 domain-containing protein [Pseudomonadota bacterium]
MARLGFYVSVIAALTTAAAGPGVRLEIWDFITGFGVLRWGAYSALAAAAVSLISLALARGPGARRARILAVHGVLFGLLAFAVPWSHRYSAYNLPPIHDISTDLENPPGFVELLAERADAPNPSEYGGPEIASQQRAAYPDIAPLRFPDPPPRVFEAALDSAAQLGWRIVAADSGQGRIEASDRTFWFGFVDDVAIRLQPAEAGTRVDLRSVSRVGRGDAGANAARIRAFSERLRQALEG